MVMTGLERGLLKPCCCTSHPQNPLQAVAGVRIQLGEEILHNAQNYKQTILQHTLTAFSLRGDGELMAEEPG